MTSHPDVPHQSRPVQTWPLHLPPRPAPLPPLGHFSVKSATVTHLPKLETCISFLCYHSPLIQCVPRYLAGNPFCCAVAPSGTQIAHLSASPSFASWLLSRACCLMFTRWPPQVWASWLRTRQEEGLGGSCWSQLKWSFCNEERKSRLPLKSLARAVSHGHLWLQGRLGT